MSLPEHLHPKTYWEERTELLEEAVVRLSEILIAAELSPSAGRAVRDFLHEWDSLITGLKNKHPKDQP